MINSYFLMHFRLQYCPMCIISKCCNEKLSLFLLCCQPKAWICTEIWTRGLLLHSLSASTSWTHHQDSGDESDSYHIQWYCSLNHSRRRIDLGFVHCKHTSYIHREKESQVHSCLYLPSSLHRYQSYHSVWLCGVQ